MQHVAGDVQQPLRLRASTFPTGSVTAASPHQPLYLQPVSMLTMSPSTSFRRPGMPWTTSRLIEMQVTAGKGGPPSVEFG